MPLRLKDKPKVVCPACGAHNDVGRLFCTKCGFQIISGDVAPVRIYQRKEKGGPRPALRNLLLAFVLVWLGTCMALIAWPFSPLGVVGSEAQAEETARVLAVLKNGLEAGAPLAPQTLSEPGFNAWARRRLPANKELRLYAGPTFVSAVATEKVFGVTVSTRVVLTRDRPDVPFSVKSFWWGHLPMPTGSAGWMTRSLSQRFRLDLPMDFWNGLRILNAERQRITLGPPPATAP